MENLLCLRGSETIQKFSLAKGGLASLLHMPCLQCVPSSFPREKPLSCRAPYRVAVVLSCWLPLELLLALRLHELQAASRAGGVWLPKPYAWHGFASFEPLPPAGQQGAVKCTVIHESS